MRFDEEDDNAKPRFANPLPKKRFGQHFLTDKNLIRKIVAAAGVAEKDQVLEIGPGRGALTEGLIEAGAIVTAVEVDRNLSRLLQERFPSDRLTVMEADAMKVSFADLSREKKHKFKLVANLPYNISGPILAKFLKEREAFSVMVLMFQKEVAERIASGPGTKSYGVLSVLSQAYTDVKIEFHVSRNLFNPKPKVDSSVVSFRVLDRPRIEIEDEAFFKAVVKSAFGTRRKTLLNSLKVLGFGKDSLLRALEEAGIDPGRRGETLDMTGFGALTRALAKLTD
ncbi:MAG: 16S rRNA (adenine(1518)-N(6)/adenine(1519)-N(6))-dimethyltransferase RsmA [Deltaproteobacteria bacterium]|nr:16S rRNA (adenine(1518)-N(6)/adenine(1519)-N(6))-dimethyltransferase RsmA [Deltaproteobacteria bacterium]